MLEDPGLCCCAKELAVLLFASSATRERSHEKGSPRSTATVPTSARSGEADDVCDVEGVVLLLPGVLESGDSDGDVRSVALLLLSMSRWRCLPFPQADAEGSAALLLAPRQVQLSLPDSWLLCRPDCSGRVARQRGELTLVVCATALEAPLGDARMALRSSVKSRAMAAHEPRLIRLQEGVQTRLSAGTRSGLALYTLWTEYRGRGGGSERENSADNGGQVSLRS